MIIKFTADVAIGTGLGVVIGAFLPSVGRNIKGLFVKETRAAKLAILTDVTKVKAKL